MESKDYVLTVEEVGKMLRISRPQAYLGVKRGDIPTIRIGKRILIPREAFERMLNNSTTTKKDIEEPKWREVT